MKLDFHVRPLRGPLSATALAALALGPASASGGVFDDAKFKLDIRGDANDNAFIDAGEVGDALDFSAASPKTTKYGGGDSECAITADKYTSGGHVKYGTMPYISVANIANSDGSTTSIPCIEFPQETKTENGTTYYARYGLRIQNAAVAPGNGGDVTIYARFRWDSTTTSPNLMVGNGWNGTWASKNGQSIFADNEGKIGVMVRSHQQSTGSPKAAKGTWYDVFVTTHNETINGVLKAVSDVSLCKADSSAAPSFTTAVLTNANEMGWTSANTLLTIGLFQNNSTGWHNNSNPRAFRGAVADVMLWNRALTDAEKLAVVAGPAPSGGEWQIGAANGSADEFDDADPATVYDVQSMPWRRMRKTLDSANPSLSISTTMASGDHQMARTLTITPILSGATSAPVEVALNGTVVGEIDLATTTSITIPRKLWRHDGEANVIAVTRTAPVSGTVQLDAVSLAPAATQTAGTVLEDATFKLDLRGGESTYTKPGDIGNAYDHSSASPLVGWMGDQRGPQTYTSSYGNLPAQETADVQNPYHPYTTKSQRVLHFYQDKKSETASVRSSIVIPGAAPQGPVQTFYLRFRWDGQAPATTTNPSYIFQSGNADNGNSTNGVGFYINQKSVSEDLSTTNAVLGVKGSNASGSLDNLKITAGEWNDVFVTFSQNAGNTRWTATVTLCKPVASAISDSDFSTPSLSSQSLSSSRPLLFNTSNLTIGGYHESSGGATPCRAFRGLIADFMVWERALTNDEKSEVMAGHHGAKWTVGAANGSADEFTDDNPAAVFEPESMPWRQMRKTLTAANPTLALKSPLAAFEAGRAMLFTLVPVPDGDAHPVRVAVNGTVVGDFDAATDGTIVIPRGNWTRDGSGDVTVTATSLDTSKPLAIDFIALSGSWQNAPDDRNSNGMLNEKFAPSRAFAGDIDVKHFTSSISVGASHTNYTFGVWVPEGMGEKAGWKFRTKTTSSVSSPVEGLDARHTVYVNGAAVGSHDGWFAANESFVLDIPAGALHDGMNYVQWVQTAPTLAAQQAVSGKPGIFQYYDFWGMTLVPPASPFMLIVR